MRLGAGKHEKLNVFCACNGWEKQECPGTGKRHEAPGWASIPELRMAALGLAWRREPIVAELLLLLLVVPSPLQVSCRVES